MNAKPTQTIVLIILSLLFASPSMANRSQEINLRYAHNMACQSHGTEVIHLKDTDGKILSEIPCREGKADGISRNYSTDGVGTVESEMSWKDGKLCTSKEYLFPNSQILYREEGKENCDDNNSLSYYKTYYSNGVLQFVRRYLGNQTMESLYYYPDGTLRLKIMVADESEDDFTAGMIEILMKAGGYGHLKAIVYDEQGQIMKDGILKKYEQDGVISSEIPFKNGMINGVVQERIDGKIMLETGFENSKQTFSYNYPNGK